MPVWLGELSCAALGADIHAVDEKGADVALSDDPADVGELVINQPMPSMPVAFWADPDGSRLREAYYTDFPGRWRHGDWLRATPRGSFVITGRSDSTLNRGGVRMGTADLYAVIEGFDEVVDSLVVDTTALGSTPGGGAAVLPRAGRRGGAGRRRARTADGAAQGAVAAARPGPVRAGRRGAADAEREEVRGPGEADPGGRRPGEGGEPRGAEATPTRWRRSWSWPAGRKAAATR